MWINQSFLHHYKEIRFRAFIRHKEFGTTGSDLLRKFRFADLSHLRRNGLERTSEHKQVVLPVESISSTVTHAFQGSPLSG